MLCWPERPFRKSEIAVIAVPQVVLGGWLVSVYDLLGKKALEHPGVGAWFADRVNMLYWYFREMNSCEHGIGILILLSPLLYLFIRDRRLLRASTAVLFFIVSITVLSPEPFPGYPMTTVRYLAPVIPACIFAAVVFINAITIRLK